MNRFLTWIIGMVIGALAGYGASFITGLNPYLCMGIGVILGSTTGITINMQRRKYRNYPLDEEQEYYPEANTDSESEQRKESS